MSVTTVKSCPAAVKWLIDGLAPAMLPCDDAAKPRSSLLRAHIIAQGPVAGTNILIWEHWYCYTAATLQPELVSPVPCLLSSHPAVFPFSTIANTYETVQRGRHECDKMT
jgi:hypothetical protein